MLLGPFAYFNITKTKYLQLFTTAMRYATFGLLIGICVYGTVQPDPFVEPAVEDVPPKIADVRVFDLGGLTFMFGVSVYSFMCQHSLPSLISPITNQRNLTGTLVGVFGTVVLFYGLLVFSAIVRFQPRILTDPAHDVYTLVFSSYPSKFISIFLQLFPVFVLSTNFPIIAITLRNNLRTLGQKFGEPDYRNGVTGAPSAASSTFDRLFYPTLAIAPPIIIAFFTQQVTAAS